MNEADRRQAILNAVAILTAQHGHPPTLDEVAAATMQNRSTVYNQCRIMRRAGLLDWADGAIRTMHLTERGKDRLPKVLVF